MEAANEPTQASSSNPEIEALLRLAKKTARAGNKAGARSLLLALAREYPSEIQVWLWLAAVAETPDEQRQALERARALDPEHPMVQQGLARLALAPEATLDQVTAPPAAAAPRPLPDSSAAALEVAEPAPPRPAREPSTAAPATDEAAERGASRFWLYLALFAAFLTIVLIIVPLYLLPDRGTENNRPTAPPLLLQTSQNAPMTAASAPALVGTAGAFPLPTVSAGPPGTPDLARTTPARAPTPASPPTPLPLGMLLEHDSWRATLLRPDYALVLDGAIGDLRPGGRFVLALVSVGNIAATARPIPPDLFTLIDAQGRTYQPLPNASSVYLATYGRGQRGDLALEDAVQPGGGMVSVPLIFDVPTDATRLLLVMGPGNTGGWQVVAAVSSDAAPTAPPTSNAAP